MNSIDTPEFRELLAQVWHMNSIAGRDKMAKPLIAHIDAHTAAQVAASKELADESLMKDALDFTQYIAACAGTSRYELEIIAKIRKLQPRIIAALKGTA